MKCTGDENDGYLNNVKDCHELRENENLAPMRKERVEAARP